MEGMAGYEAIPQRPCQHLGEVRALRPHGSHGRWQLRREPPRGNPARGLWRQEIWFALQLWHFPACGRSLILREPQFPHFKNEGGGASLVAQWLRICLLMQGTRVRALVWEDPTCHGAAGPVSHNY